MPIFLGIDPGIATTGYGVVESIGSKLVHVGSGVILTSPKEALPDRLVRLSEELRQVILTYNPMSMAVEELFFSNNAKTAFVVGQARGVILLTGAQLGKGIMGYTPLQVKIAVCGYGKADKKQVQLMVQRLLHLPTLPKPDDLADALAIAICHSQSYKLKSL
jgi:crossover junction endodeoxyribonuclease RuvC